MNKMMNGIEFGLLMILGVLSILGSISVICNHKANAQTKEPVVSVEMVVEDKTTEFFDSIETEGIGYTPLTEMYMVSDNIPLWEGFQVYAQYLCELYHVNYAFFLAMCESESGFDETAVGDSGKSIGLMQLRKCNWERYDLDASFAYDNLEIGVRMLSELIEKYQEIDAVIMAYKGGEAKADQWIAEGFRLGVCDTVVDRTMYWQEVIDKEKGLNP